MTDVVPTSAPTLPRAPTRHVALLIETSGSYGRGILQGIARFNRTRGAWSTFFRPEGPAAPPPEWLRGWKGDGMLMRIDTKELADLARRSKVPVVNLRGTFATHLPFPYVTADNAKVGELAAEHLRERGLREFAFVGRPRGTNPTLDERGDHFQLAVKKAGLDVHVFPAQRSRKRSDWEDEQDRLAEWIRDLPKPVGVMACNDEMGLQVLDACRRCGAAVPDDVAVIGVDNDVPLCELAIPPLTSVDVNPEGIGYAAAELLENMMSGRKASENKPIKIQPRGVVTRRSTDIIASEDEEVGRAARFIREHACNGLQIADVLSHMGMSRATLQQRMKQTIGRTIHQEIQRVKLNHAKARLLDPSATIKQVARESGFASVQYLTRVFHAMTGETPAKYRARRVK
jgi:LacI family transcriptional regulator